MYNLLMRNKEKHQFCSDNTSSKETVKIYNTIKNRNEAN